MGRSSKKLIIIASAIVLAILYAGLMVYAEPPAVTLVVPFGAPGSAPAVCGSIAGKVLDADGNPVSNAVVTLWNNGVAVNMGNGTYCNPQTSQYYSYTGNPEEGSYDFIPVYPGNYTVTAEKDGYKGSISAYVGNETVHRTIQELNGSNDTITGNIILKSYHVQALTPEQLSYKGAITGKAYDQNSVVVPAANITLWQNGKIVEIPKNPQYAYYNGTYLFEHLAPGQYQVTAEKEWHFSSPVTVIMSNAATEANITIRDYAWAPPAASLPPSSPVVPRASDAPVPQIADTPQPTSAAGILTVLLSTTLASVYAHRSGKWPKR